MGGDGLYIFGDNILGFCEKKTRERRRSGISPPGP
jgi:hypothetical protein